MNKRKSISKAISRQQRNFLLLELLIALFLISSFILPLAQFPMQAIQEEFKSAHRMHAERLAQGAFAKIKKKLHAQEISWEEITRPSTQRALVFEDTVSVEFESLGKRDFKVQGTLWSVGKKLQNGEELRLTTVQVQVGSTEKKYKPFRTKKSSRQTRTFTYQLLIQKAAIPPASIDLPQETA